MNVNKGYVLNSLVYSKSLSDVMTVFSFLVQALFDHRNVLSLIGVITAPRDMPTLLVLAYCDNGSLLDHVQDQGEETNASTKLTFCAEVAQGMEYIASRRVVRLCFLKGCRYFIVVDSARALVFTVNIFWRRFTVMWLHETSCLTLCWCAK